MNLRRFITVTLIIGLGVVALFSSSGARTTGRRLSESQEELQQKGKALEKADAELQRRNDQLLHEFAAEFEARQFWTFREPSPDLTRDARLQRAIRFYSEYLEHHSRDESKQGRCAQVHFQLGNVYRAQDRLNLATEHFRLAARLFDELVGANGDSEWRRPCGRAYSRLSCVQTVSGYPIEALRSCLRAIRALQQPRHVPPDNTAREFELSLAMHNRGLIQQQLGRDGTESLCQSLSVIRPLIRGLNGHEAIDELRLKELELLRNTSLYIDTSQLLALWLWQEQRISECRLLVAESIGVLEQLLTWIDRLGNDHLYELPMLKYQAALDQARLNAERLIADRSAGDSVTTTTGQAGHRQADSAAYTGWCWRPLFDVDEMSLHHGLLESGRLPAEFERQETLLIAWRDAPWLRKSLLDMIENVQGHIQLTILVTSDQLESEARGMLQAASVPTGEIRFMKIATNSQWVRDFGPQVIETGSGTIRLLDSKYLPLLRPSDDLVPWEVARRSGHSVLPNPLFLDGGEILSNGAGLVLVSSAVHEKNCRNGHDPEHVSSTLKRLTGADKLIYLDPLVDEPTRHIDWFITFTAADTVVIGDYQGTDSVNSELLDRHARFLEGQPTRAGPLKVVRIPMPPRRDDYFGGTFTNVVFANGVLLVPTWPDVPADLETIAFDTYRRLLPGWRIIGIESHELGRRNGSLHCATMNLYRAEWEKRTSPSAANAPLQLNGSEWLPVCDGSRADGR